MPEAIRWKSKIVLAKTEAAYGTDPLPTGAANAMLMTDVQLQPMEGQEVSRNLERPYLGAQAEIPSGLRAVLSGSVELVGSGSAGVAPAWGPLARACGLAQIVTPDDSVEYLPISSAMESVHIAFWIGGTRHVLKGCRGTAVITVNAQAIPVMRFTLTGLWIQPSEVARPSPDVSEFMAPAVATMANTPAFTVNGVGLVLRSFSFNLGNQVEPRLLIGREEILISNRAEEIMASVEAVPLSTFNPFALALSMTQTPVVITHGVTAGRIVTITAPTSQMKRLTGYENQQEVLEWPLRLMPLPLAGNDQFSITLT